MSSQTPFTYVRDGALFIIGALIILKQAGIFFAPPSELSLPLIALAALCCNVPGALQVMAWRFGRDTGQSSSPPDSPSPVSPSPPLSAPSSGGE